MANRFFYCVSLSLLFLSLAAAATSDAPFIIAHKKATLKRLKSGKEHVLVSIDIYNEGSARVLQYSTVSATYCSDGVGVAAALCRRVVISITGVVIDPESFLGLLPQRTNTPLPVASLWTAYDVSLTDDSWPQDSFDVISGKTSNSWEKLDAGAHVSHSFELEAKVKGQFQGAPAVIKYRVPTKAALQEAYSTPIFPLDILEDRPPEKKLDWRFLAKYGSLISAISIVVLFVYLVASPSSASKASKKKR
ncbi:hypothetical protein Cgig2_011557 [Carnegiea gigantea]|uniref:Translocon-associated protein subunit beta n=1 Tax=Carnegiea gigantea TaxID=171969 RepID=A0A9Q1JG25_9CARY|nr:hypothetical protein Cgig2_011557 [Carnegiea gigantea]